MSVAPEFEQALGRRIAARRLSLKMTQGHLASAIGLGRTSIVNIEAGRQQMLLGTFLAVCQSMNTTPQAMLKGLEGYIH